MFLTEFIFRSDYDKILNSSAYNSFQVFLQCRTNNKNLLASRNAVRTPSSYCLRLLVLVFSQVVVIGFSIIQVSWTAKTIIRLIILFLIVVWNGLTLADLVFPWFTWMMGVSIVLSQRSLRSKNVRKRNILFKICQRTIILFFLGKS